MSTGDSAPESTEEGTAVRPAEMSAQIREAITRMMAVLPPAPRAMLTGLIALNAEPIDRIITGLINPNNRLNDAVVVARNKVSEIDTEPVEGKYVGRAMFLLGAYGPSNGKTRREVFGMFANPDAHWVLMLDEQREAAAWCADPANVSNDFTNKASAYLEAPIIKLENLFLVDSTLTRTKRPKRDKSFLVGIGDLVFGDWPRWPAPPTPETTSDDE